MNKPETIEAGKIPIASNGSVCQISINAEYFRPKFEEILKRRDSCMGGADECRWEWAKQESKELLDELIDCIKNPEGI